MAVVVRVSAVAGDADPRGGAARELVHEDVGELVVVAGGQVRRGGDEGGDPSVAGDRGKDRARGRLVTVAGDAEAARGAPQSIAHETIVRVVGVAGDERRRLRLKDDPSSVRRRADIEALGVGLGAVAGDAGAFDGRILGVGAEHADVEPFGQAERGTVVGAAHEARGAVRVLIAVALSLPTRTGGGAISRAPGDAAADTSTTGAAAIDASDLFVAVGDAVDTMGGHADVPIV